MEGERTLRIPAGHGRAFRVTAGDRFAVVTPEGKQVGDFIAFNAADLTEWLSTAHTRRSLGRVEIRHGDCLVSTLRRPMVDIVEDTVGKHDILAAPCDPRRYFLDYGIKDHRSCLDNFVEALSEYHLEAWRIPNPVNLFQNTRIEEGGKLVTYESLAKPGDRIVFLARMDLIAAVSSCPQDQAPINGFRVKDLRVDFL